MNCANVQREMCTTEKAAVFMQSCDVSLFVGARSCVIIRGKEMAFIYRGAHNLFGPVQGGKWRCYLTHPAGWIKKRYTVEYIFTKTAFIHN